MKQIQTLLLLIIFLFSSSKILHAKLISPKEKPSNLIYILKEEKKEPVINNEIKLNKNNKEINSKIKEKKIEKPIQANTSNKIVKEKETIIEKDMIIVVDQIIPPKKPLLLGSENLNQSNILNAQDFNIAKKTFSHIKRRSWKSAFLEANKASDVILSKIVRWMYLKESNNQASFYDYLQFINENPEWPRILRLKYLAEHKIDYKDVDPNDVINFFTKYEPASGYGKLKLGEAYLIKGNLDKGTPLVQSGFKYALLDKEDLKYISTKFKDILTSEDYIERAKYLAWEQEYWELNRTIPYLPKGYKELYAARFALMTRSYGVDNAISKVPSKFIKDAGLQYDRMKWRRKRGRYDSALEIIDEYSKNPELLVKPELWMKEKHIIARRKIDQRKYQDAYDLYIDHGITTDSSYLADAEWHAGWLALRFLNKPDSAIKHFKEMYESVGYPISKSRGAYWLGKSYETINNLTESSKWYSIASSYNTTFYGQLAATKINKKTIQIKNDYILDKDNYEKFLKSEVSRAIILLAELKQSSQSKDMLKHYGIEKSPVNLRTYSGTLAQKINRLDYAIQIAKQASYEGINLLDLNYPIIETPKIVSDIEILNQEYILALIRQESEFDASANSYVGARGLMQIMPATGKLLSKRLKLNYSSDRLTEDEFYNLQLGSFYITDLYKNFDNNIYMALAGYNAGPHRVNKWIKRFGDPRKNEIDPIDFIEHIPFEETRNYVQRVMENINVYKFILEKKSTPNNIEELLYRPGKI